MMLSSAITLPISIERLLVRAFEAVSPSKIILFGSRARGDARNVSDFDLAFVIDPDRQSAWNRFLFDMEELPITFYPLDLIA